MQKARKMQAASMSRCFLSVFIRQTLRQQSHPSLKRGSFVGETDVVVTLRVVGEYGGRDADCALAPRGADKEANKGNVTEGNDKREVPPSQSGQDSH